jgi:hypothetical protein
MKIKKYINKNILSIIFCFLLTNLSAQKKQNKFDIISLNLIQSDLKVENANLIISNKSDMSFDLNYSVNNGKGAKDSFTIFLKFRGRGLKDPTKAIEYKKRLDEAKRIRSEEPVVLTNVVIEIYNERGLVLIDSVNITFNKNINTNFAVLLNGIKSNDFCEEQKINHVFMNEFKSSKYYAVVIGLNNTKKEPSDIEIAVSNGRGKMNGIYVWTESHDKRTTRVVEPFTDKNGNWFFKDSFVNEKDAVKLLSFSIEYISACNDSFKYVSVLKQQLSEKKPWDYKVKMSNAIDNPTFEPANGGMTNIMALTFPSSSVTINGGDFIISDNSKLTVGIVNNKAISNGFDTKKVTDANIDIQYSVAGDGRVFWHWSFPVTTTNPKGVIDLDTNKIFPLKIESAEIRFITDEKDTIIYENNGKYAMSLDGKEQFLLLEKIGMIKYIDPCKTKYKLKQIDYAANNFNGIYTYQFWIKFENNSDVPEKVAMVIEIKDCSGKSQFVKITLKYDEKNQYFYWFASHNIK